MCDGWFRRPGETRGGIWWSSGNWWTALGAFPAFGGEENAFLRPVPKCACVFGRRVRIDTLSWMFAASLG